MSGKGGNTGAKGHRRFRATGNRAVRLATTGRRLTALSSVDAQGQGASLLRLAMHPPGPPLADRTPLLPVALGADSSTDTRIQSVVHSRRSTGGGVGLGVPTVEVVVELAARRTSLTFGRHQLGRVTWIT